MQPCHPWPNGIDCCLILRTVREERRVTRPGRSEHHNTARRSVSGIVVYALPNLMRSRDRRHTHSNMEQMETRFVSKVINRATRMSGSSRTSQSFTSFIISLSRASAACWRLYASLSPSASRRGTKWIRDHAFSRSSSLRRQV